MQSRTCELSVGCCARTTTCAEHSGCAREGNIELLMKRRSPGVRLHSILESLPEIFFCWWKGYWINHWFNHWRRALIQYFTGPGELKIFITGVHSRVLASHKCTFIRRVTQRGNWRCNPIIDYILDNSMDCKNWCLIENCAKFIGGDEKVNYAMRQEFLSGKLNNTPNWLLIVERWWCDKGVASAGDWSMTNWWSSSPL